jgi:nucleoside-diphosphate-sugar epimerase
MGERNVLVTGAAGFIGANLVRRLLRDGHSVCATHRRGGDPWRLAAVASDVELVEVDLRDAAAVESLVRRVRPRVAFHLAAHGAYSWQADARGIFETNLLALVALAQACATSGVEMLLHTGSSSEYGAKDHAPAEHEYLDPDSTYAVAKAAATHYLRHLARRGDLRAVTVRLYSAYGPWEDPRRFFPRLIAAGLKGELPPLADPDTARDFVYVADVIDAIVLVANATTFEPGAVYNVGSGHQATLREVVALARDELDVRAEPAWGSGEQRSWDTATWVADASRIRSELGWRPRHSLQEGFRATVNWLRGGEAPAERYGVCA